MNSIMKKTAITGAAAAAALAVGMGPASAFSTSYTATSTGSVTLTAGVAMSCTSAGAAGTADSVTAPAQVGVISSTTWNNCTALGAPSFPSQTGTWNINANSVSGGVASGNISNISATVSIPAVGCTLTVTGSVPATWNNGTQQLGISGGGLSVSKSGFCLGVSSSGTFSATYNVTSSPAIIVS